MKSMDRVGRTLVSLMIGFVMLFLILPPFMIVLLSLEPGDIVRFPITGVTWYWYWSFLHRESLVTGLRTSIILAGSATPIAVVMGLLCAYALTRYEIRGKQYLSTLFLSPLSLPAVVFGISLLAYFSMMKFNLTFGRLLIAHVILCIPYVLRTCMAALVGLDISLEDAARNLGASEIQTFSKITVPLVKPGLMAAAVFSFVTSFDDIGVSIFLTNYQTTTLPVALFGLMKHVISPEIAAVSSVLLILTCIVVIVVEKTVGLEKFTGI